jgi:hypothetical protein
MLHFTRDLDLVRRRSSVQSKYSTSLSKNLCLFQILLGLKTILQYDAVSCERFLATTSRSVSFCDEEQGNLEFAGLLLGFVSNFWSSNAIKNVEICVVSSFLVMCEQF